MWLAMFLACGMPEDPENPALESTFALEWGAANRSEAVKITDRPDGGWYGIIEIASPARTDPRLIAIDETGTVDWEQQWGRQGDDEYEALVTLSSGLLATGGRIRLQPTEDSDSVANVTLIDPAGPEIVDDRYYEWNASSETDRVVGITEVEDGVLTLVGEAGPQWLFAEVDTKPEVLLQERSDPEDVDILGSVALGEGDFVLYGTIFEPTDPNDGGQLWAAEVHRGGDVFREESAGEPLTVRDVTTDFAIVDGSWIIAGETGEPGSADVRMVSYLPGSSMTRFEVTWDSGGSDRDPQLFLAPDGTLWGAVVRNRDELIPLRIDPSNGDVTRLTGVVGVDRVRDLWVDDERFCVALTLPGDVDGGFLASIACGAFDGDEIIWPELRDEGEAETDA